MNLPRPIHSLLLALGATAGLLQVYALPIRYNTGPEGRWWELVRRVASRLLGRLDSRAGPRPITDGEFAGAFRGSLDELERRLYRDGFRRNPTARLKTRAGKPEDGSWAYRESPLSPQQLHFMLFETEDGVDVYAHEELSSINPLCASAHFSGEGQSVARGVMRCREYLDLDQSGATVEPPDGAWNSERKTQDHE